MAALIDFRRNTDYTAQKGRTKLSVSVSAPAVSLAAGAASVYSADVAAPAGVFFERAVISHSLSNKKMPVNYALYETSDIDYIISVRQLNNNTYRLQITVQNVDMETAHTSTPINASASISLAVSPFD